MGTLRHQRAVLAWLTLVTVLLAARGAAAEIAAPPRLEVTTEDGSTSLRLRFVGQIQWRFELEDPGDGAALEHENTILFRRIRPIIGGSLFTRDFTYALQLNLVPGALELDDFWLGYRIHDQAQIRLGQFKIPFTRYRMNSFADLPVVDWSRPTQWFGAERQMGLMLHNGVGSPPMFEYQAGIFTGVNARASNGTAMPRLYGAPQPNPSLLADPAAPSSFHPELVGHFAYNHGGIDVRRPTDREGGPARFSVGLSAAWDPQPAATQDMAIRLAPEFAFKAYGFHLLGVFYAVFFDEVEGRDRMRPGMLGVVAQASYFFVERLEVALRYTHISVLEGLRDDARAHADGQIAAAADLDEQAALMERYADVGQVTAEHELTLGLNIFLLGDGLKLQVDGGLLAHDRLDETRYDMIFRVQSQIRF